MSRRSQVLAVFASCLLLWAARADARPRLKTYTGTFTSTQVACDTMCTSGPLTGGLEGTLSWRLDSMEATSDPDVVKLVGVDTVTTARGSFSGPDYTLWNLATGDFVDVAVIDHGSGAFAGARGTLILQGAFDPAAGEGSSHYVAALKLSN